MEKVIVCEQTGYDHEEISGHIRNILLECNMEFELSEMDVCIHFCSDISLDGRYMGAHPEVLLGLVSAVCDMGADRVMVIDTTETATPFFGCGFEPGQIALLKSKADVIKSETAAQMTVEMPDGDDVISCCIPQAWYEADVCISTNKLKTDLFTDAHTAATDLIALAPRSQRHSFFNYLMHERIALFYNVRKPDFVLVDAIEAGEGQGPLHPAPVEMNLLFGGKNSLAVDTVGCSLMGINAVDVDHLRLLNRVGRGPVMMRDIKVVNAELLERGRKFKLAEWDIEGISPHIAVSGGSKRYCASGCVGMLRQALDPWLERMGPQGLESMHCIVGRPVEAMSTKTVEDCTVVVGGCAASFEEHGHYVPGIPPKSCDVEIEVMRIQGGERFLRAMPTLRRLHAAGAPNALIMNYLRSRVFEIRGEEIRLSPFSIPAFMARAFFRRLFGKAGAGQPEIPSRCLSNY